MSMCMAVRIELTVMVNHDSHKMIYDSRPTDQIITLKRSDAAFLITCSQFAFQTLVLALLR